MLFSRPSQSRVSRRRISALPTLERCESRQLMSGLQVSANLSVLKKHAPAEVTVVPGISTASVVGIGIKHGW